MNVFKGFIIGFVIGLVVYHLVRLVIYVVKRTVEFVVDLLRYTFLGVRGLIRFAVRNHQQVNQRRQPTRHVFQTATALLEAVHGPLVQPRTAKAHRSVARQDPSLN